MKKKLSLLLALSMLLALCACSQPAEPAATQNTAPTNAESSAPEESTEATTKSGTDAIVVDTVILKEADDNMINTYTLLAVNPDAPFADADGNSVPDVKLNSVGASALINWMLSEEGQDAAANYGFADYGEYLFYLLDGRPVSTAEIPEAAEETRLIRLSTTTSVNDSGLLSYLLPIFEEKYGYEVEVYSAGTGKAIANAKMGNADAILVHAKAQEESFVADGFACVLDGMDTERMSYMYNYFVLCGPSDDPAGVREAEDVLAAFAAIADGKYSFVSRGDNSGTHTKELALWPEELGITAEAESFAGYTDWYTSANAGMGACLVMAEQTHAYILTDKATFLTFVANDGAVN